MPGKRFIHLLALVPTVSPPFAIALSTILLFGRNGLITRKLLGMTSRRAPMISTGWMAWFSCR